MIAVVDSITGQGVRFAEKVGLPIVEIYDYRDQEENVLLFTRSYNFGEVTEEAHAFLEEHADQVKGVVVSGNRNWGNNFGAAGDEINRFYHIELVLKYEGSGFPEDVKAVKAWIEKQER